ncbi:MerR family transcriptional regulator [Nocardia grenadensis]|uniref:MerR family transcriptional regulator n=1 Tax=Nocardia grenadensis TaxID=931537 RepID=UPI003D941CA3
MRPAERLFRPTTPYPSRCIPVRTIRLYCDEELLPAHRTSGGHRMFTEEALTRLASIRRCGRPIGPRTPSTGSASPRRSRSTTR